MAIRRKLSNSERAIAGGIRWCLYVLFAFVAAIMLALTSSARAGDFSLAAVPTRVEATAYGGVMIFGPFGNPAGCTTSDMIFVLETHPEFKLIQAMVMLSVAGGKPIRLYAHGCQAVGWYSSPTTTYNTVSSGAVSIAP